MAAIDIGAGAIDRGAAINYGYTYVDLNNPANDTGILTSFEVWLATKPNTGGVKIGTYSGASGTYSNRDYESFASVTNGSKQTFTGLNCDVVSGDYIGIYLKKDGTLDYDSSGYSGRYSKAGDQFGLGKISGYSLGAGDALSLYGTGATVGGGSLPILRNNFRHMIVR